MHTSWLRSKRAVDHGYVHDSRTLLILSKVGILILLPSHTRVFELEFRRSGHVSFRCTSFAVSTPFNVTVGTIHMLHDLVDLLHFDPE